MSDEQLDREIDRAVREMMSVDAPGGFRARILSKLEERPRRFGWMTFAGLGTAAAAAAVVLLMTRTPAPVRQPPPSQPPAQVAGDAARPADTTPPVVTPPSGVSKAPVGVERPAAVERHVVAAVATSEPETTIAALAEIDPLVVPPVSAPDIAPAAIAIAPLPEIPEIEVKPLSPPDGRN